MTAAAARRLLGGLAIVSLLAITARVISTHLPADVSELAVGLVLGLLVANLLRLGPAVAIGGNVAMTRVLRLGVAVLGAQLDLGDIAGIGADGLLAVIAAMLVAMLVAIGVGRLLSLAPSMSVLIGIGTSICGNSAIAAISPIIRAKPQETSLAMGTITMFGTLGVVLYPAIGHALSMPDSVFGPWVGIAVSDTGQAAAAGFAYSTDSGEAATVVKLIRNSMLGPAILMASVVHAASQRRATGIGARATRAGMLRTALPLFIVAFAGMVLLNTAGLIPPPLQALLLEVSRVSILMALVGLGMTTRLATMRHLGLRVLTLGLAAACLNAAFGLGVATVAFG